MRTPILAALAALTGLAALAAPPAADRPVGEIVRERYDMKPRPASEDKDAKGVLLDPWAAARLVRFRDRTRCHLRRLVPRPSR